MTLPGNGRFSWQFRPKAPALKTVIARSAATWQSVSPAMRTHCTGREAGQLPRPVLRPWRGAQALRLAGERIATPACALVRNDRLGSAEGLEAGAEVPASQRRGQDPRPTVQASQCTHTNAPGPQRRTCRAGARPRRAPANLPGTLAPTHQAPEPVIARSAATWQSVPPQGAALHRP